jgi:N-acetylneuraminic acid mutarotase
MTTRTLRGVGAACLVLALGCIDVDTIPAPGLSPDALQWTQPPEPTHPSARSGHAMAALGDKVVLFGGLSDEPTNDTWTWDGRTWTRVFQAAGPSVRTSYAMATLGDKVILFGGLAVGGSGGLVYNDTWAWDGATWTRLLTPGPAGRQGHAMVTLGDKLILFGGDTTVAAAGAGEGTATADTWEFDGAKWTRLDTAVAPPARSQHAMATLGNKIVLFGGMDDGGHSLDDTWEWDGSTWARRTEGLTPEARRGHAMATLGSDVYLFGGDLGPVADPVGGSVRLWKWDGSTWTSIGPFCPIYCPNAGPAWRSGLAMTSYKEGVLLFGGQGFSDTWEWHGNWWRQRATNISPPADGEYPSAIAVLHDKVIVLGDLLPNTLEWDGSTWSAVGPNSPTNTPFPARHGMAALGDKLVHFGGNDSDPAPVADTWEFDGTTWTTLTPPTSAPARAGHAMATLGDEVILFGGWGPDPVGGGNTLTNATWAWNGKTWAHRYPATSPSPRHDHAMATLGNEIVLFGGETADALLNDTWLWNGATWTRLFPPTSPSARRGHELAGLNGRVILFGGRDANGLLNDTWAFESGTWKQLAPSTSPAERENPAMAAVGGEIVLVGGAGIADTWLLGPAVQGASK